MVYVINLNGKPLMPTNRYAKVRVLLKENKAKVVNSKPFTIQLLYSSTEFVKLATLGIDSGYLNIGYSVLTNNKELISGEVKLLKGMSERLKEKRMYRIIRRNRLRYRKPRFDNRKRSTGWLAPSVQHKYDSHIRFIDKLKKIVPISNIIIEVANFDTHLLKNPNISGEEYQNGEQNNFFNLREYVLHRDGHKCQNPNCKNKDKNIILQVHHLAFWKKDRTDRPGNLLTLCTNCHISKNHKENGFLWGWEPKVKSFKDATFMSTVRWRLVNTFGYKHTYGYDTKLKRIALKLDKTHYNDAFCIAGGNVQSRVELLIYEQIKRNNRSLEKFYDSKIIDTRTGKKVSGVELFNGRRTRNKNLNSEDLRTYRGEKISKGQRRIRTKRYFYQPGDLVKYENIIYTVKGTQNNGAYVALKEIKKVPKVQLLTPYRFRKGLVPS
ncbi:RNA-guided endonuclease IscB [Clostridium sp.]|uniref:RNA-guided endonuclease IscB n=1 Tax=Clostridium sp. TaxID=1506 RepID=UPI00261B4BFC|nr:RNA-guided endonuclease IscB [uncultured Clostridium sp.]